MSLKKSVAATMLAGAASLFVSTGSALASESWPSIMAEAYAGRVIEGARDIVTLKAPYRPENVMSVPLTATAELADGRTIRSVTFIVDENPAPIAAVFKLGPNRAQTKITTNIRLDQGSDVRVIVEASDGALYMTERHVKFAGGQASCSAPPNGDPEEILANMGRMDFAVSGQRAHQSKQKQSARFSLSHPNHTGMVLDQITLYYVPLLMVDRIEARQGDELVFEMTGSITLAQDPSVEFDYLTNGASEITVKARDTSGTTWQRRFPIGPQS